MEKTRAILIRRHRLTETSLIAVWLTRDAGKLRTAARGALRPGTPFFGKVDLFFEAEIGFVRSRRGDLHQLREIAAVTPFDGRGADYANLAAASYFGELIDATTESQAAAPELFDLLRRAVAHLRGRPATLRAVEFFETELARLLGVNDPSGRQEPIEGLAMHGGRVPASRGRLRKLLGASACAAPADS